MARAASNSGPSLSIIQLFLAAAILTALGAITHSGIVPGLFLNDENEFLSNQPGPNPYRRQYSFLQTIPKFNRTKYTFDSFVVAGGMELAGFGLDDAIESRHIQTTPQPSLRSSSHDSYSFELFEDFDLSHKIQGNETWIELLEYRRDATHPSLSFYVDKVAFKRWLVASDLQIDGIESYLLQYASELEKEVELMQTKNPNLSKKDRIAQELLRSLPTDVDYAAKPTHLSCSGGVWLVHKDSATNTTYVGNGKKKMKAWASIDSSSKKKKKEPNSLASTDVRKEIAEDLSSNLQKVQEKCGRTVIESYALRHVRPGIVVEERFTQPSSSSESKTNEDESFLKGGMEFKVFTIWGRAWLTVWRPGTDGVKALFFRNGTNLVFDPPAKKKKTTETIKPAEAAPEIPTLPEWLDWDQVISIAEKLGQHKDMFRTDIFVGVSSSARSTTGGSTEPTIRYVVSETEIHPTPLRGFERVFEEAGRLWLAGYYHLFSDSALQVVPNTEVPKTFYKKKNGDAPPSSPS